MHSHLALVAYAIIGGNFKFASPDGQSMEMEVPAGHAIYMGASEYAAENVGTA